MLMVYLCAKFDMPRCKGLLIITIKQKVKYGLCMAIIVLFYIFI
jgi:hypothetical protein